jgi:hypothetical protein
MRASIRKSLRTQLLNTVLFAALSPAPQAAAQVTLAPAPPAATLGSHGERAWRVQYMGGPAPLRRSTPVELTIAAGRIVYRERRHRSAEAYSIPAAEITDVSDEVITGKRDEKLFGGGDPDLWLPCFGLPDQYSATTCLGILGGPELVSGALRGVLSLVPYTDRFIRITWHEPDGVREVAVFQVRGEDYAGLVEAVESAAPGIGEDETASALVRQVIEPVAQAAVPPQASPVSNGELFNDWWKRSNPYALEMRSTADRVPRLNLRSASSFTPGGRAGDRAIAQ